MSTPEPDKSTQDAPSPGTVRHVPAFLEIHLERRRRIWGWLAYILLFAVVAAVAVWIMVSLGTALAAAIAIVAFMVAYMLLMAWWASRNAERFGQGRDEFR